MQASKEAARKEAEETAAVAAAEREAAAKEKMEEKAAKAAARALKAEQKAAAQAEKAAHRAAQKVALDRSARDFGHLERAAKRKSDNGGVAGSRPLSPNDDSNFGNEKKHRPLIRSPGLAETSNDPEHTPHVRIYIYIFKRKTRRTVGCVTLIEIRRSGYCLFFCLLFLLLCLCVVFGFGNFPIQNNGCPTDPFIN